MYTASRSKKKDDSSFTAHRYEEGQARQFLSAESTEQ